MAMDAKQDLLRTVEAALAETVTVSDMNRIMCTISDVLEGYDVHCLATSAGEVGMIDRDKVIKGLEHCADRTQIMCNPTCPYHERVFCESELASDALALLKEQEPKLLTLEEVKEFDWEYCYLEEERLPGKEYRTVCGDYALTCITWPCVASMRIQHGDNNYGKKWRCWTAKPTDEQRKAVKWND